MKFALVLKDLLSENGISQQQLASGIGFSQRAVSKWVIGQSEPSETAIVACAKFFNVSTDELLGINDNAPSAEKKHLGLSAEEKEILRRFRSLSQSKKENFYSYLSFLSSQK